MLFKKKDKLVTIDPNEVDEKFADLGSNLRECKGYAFVKNVSSNFEMMTSKKNAEEKTEEVEENKEPTKKKKKSKKNKDKVSEETEECCSDEKEDVTPKD